MSGGGSSAPSPDKNIGKAALANIELGKQWMQFAKEQFAVANARQVDVDSLNKKVVDSQLALQDKSDRRGDEQWERYNKVFKPVEDKMVQEANDYGTPAMQAEEAARAKADVQRNADLQKGATKRSMAAMGVRPDSGRFADVVNTGDINTALASAGGQNNARIMSRDKGMALRAGVAGFGKGMPNTALATSALGINAGNSAVGNNMISENNFRANQGVMNTGFQGNMAGNSSGAGILNNLYQNNLNAWSTEQSQANQGMAGLMSAAGTGLGAYAALSG